VTSRVVQTHHPAVWQDKQLTPALLRQMLDSSITRLTGLADAREAWAALFRPNEKIAIKVNAFMNSTIWTHVPLVQAVTDSLQEAGVPADQIVIYDATTSELKTAGYTVNKDGPGVRCFGTDYKATGGYQANGMALDFSNLLLGCDALINMPVLKSHMISGFTFAMKNHYGSVTSPSGLHPDIGHTMAELNALAPIKDKTRLVIGDILEANINYKNSWPYWSADYTGDSILMSFDTLAHDAVGLDILTKLKTDSTATMLGMATPCLTSGAAAGLGASDLAQIEFVETNLS